ncbi:YraN family protein [Actinomycetota bacterium]
MKTIGNKTPLSTRSLGNIGEAIACLVLKKKNYRIIEQNFNTGIGEVDIIAAIGGTLVFIEVKTRTSDDFGSPSESMDSSKVLKIRKAAGCYLTRNDVEIFRNFRFDIITIMVKKNILRTALQKIFKDEINGNDIKKIAPMMMNSCIIEHIESAF